MQLLVAASDWQDRDAAMVESLVRDNVTAEDWVLCYHNAYYALKGKAGMVFLPGYINNMSEEEKARLTVILAPPQWVDHFAREVGGEWRPTGANIQSKRRPIIKASLFKYKYDMQMLRKTPGRDAETRKRLEPATSRLDEPR